MAGFTATAQTDVAATAQQVWAALTEPEQIATYMHGSQVATTWAIGSTVVWNGEYEGRSYQDKGEVLAYDEPHVLSMTHYSPVMGQPDEPESYHTLVYTLTALGRPYPPYADPGRLRHRRAGHAVQPQLAADAGRPQSARRSLNHNTSPPRLSRLPMDPTQVSFKDAEALAALSARVAGGSDGDRRLVAQISDPVPEVPRPSRRRRGTTRRPPTPATSSLKRTQRPRRRRPRREPPTPTRGSDLPGISDAVRSGQPPPRRRRARHPDRVLQGQRSPRSDRPAHHHDRRHPPHDQQVWRQTHQDSTLAPTTGRMADQRTVISIHSQDRPAPHLPPYQQHGVPAPPTPH